MPSTMRGALSSFNSAIIEYRHLQASSFSVPLS
jgi:hypothetical protein